MMSDVILSVAFFVMLSVVMPNAVVPRVMAPKQLFTMGNSRIIMKSAYEVFFLNISLTYFS